jgi:hypothetical protein
MLQKDSTKMKSLKYREPFIRNGTFKKILSAGVIRVGESEWLFVVSHPCVVRNGKKLSESVRSFTSVFLVGKLFASPFTETS